MTGVTLIAASLIAALECAHIVSPFLNETEQWSERLDVTRRIRYGAPARYAGHPHLLFFEYSSATFKEGTSCTGSFIATRWIMTAAHCVEPLQLELRLGQVHLAIFTVADENRNRPFRLVKVDELYRHPGWRGNDYPEDIGLIKIDADVPGIELISLPFPGEEADVLERDLKLTFAGAGLLMPGTPFTKETEVMTACSSPVGWFWLARSNYPLCSLSFCTWTISCRGDSGSPLSYVKTHDTNLYDVVIAVHSAGSTDCKKLPLDEPAVMHQEYYSSVSTAMPWILMTLGNDYHDTRPINIRSLWLE